MMPLSRATGSPTIRRQEILVSAPPHPRRYRLSIGILSAGIPLPVQLTVSGRLRAIQLAMTLAAGIRIRIRPVNIPLASIPMAGIRQGRGTMPDTRLPLRMAAKILGPIRRGPTGLISIRPPVIQQVSNILLGSIQMAVILTDSILALRIHKGPISRDRAIPASIRLVNTPRAGIRAINTRWASIPAISIPAGSILPRLPCPGPTRSCPRAGIQGQCPTAG